MKKNEYPSVNEAVDMLMFIIAAVLAVTAPISLAIEGDHAFIMADEVTVRFIITIAPHPDNRFAVLAWDSEDGDAGTSYIYHLEEDRITYRLAIKMHPGHYVVAGILGRTGDRELISEPRTLVIVPTAAR